MESAGKAPLFATRPRAAPLIGGLWTYLASSEFICTASSMACGGAFVLNSGLLTLHWNHAVIADGYVSTAFMFAYGGCKFA